MARITRAIFVLGVLEHACPALAEPWFVRAMPKHVPSPSVEVPSASAIRPEHAVREGTRDGAARQHESPARPVLTCWLAVVRKERANAVRRFRGRRCSGG